MSTPHTSPQLTSDFVRSVLSYDKTTGVFVWRSLLPRSNRKIGDRAGSVKSNSRRYITIAGKQYLAHRLAWLYVYGAWPKEDIHPKNGNPDDCRIDNLAEQTRQVIWYDDPEQASPVEGRKLRADSKSGHTGVTWHVRARKWNVCVTRDYKQVCLGYFDDLQDAITCRKRALKELVIVVTPDDRARLARRAMVRQRRNNQ